MAYDALFTSMEWDYIEYQLKKVGDVCKKSPGLQGTTDNCLSLIPMESESIPLSSFRKKRTEMKQGHVTERRAGKYVERKVRKFQSSGGHICRLPYESLWSGEKVLKPYVRNEDLKIDYDTGELYYDYNDVRFCKENSSRMADPKQVRRTCENFKWLCRANECHIRLFVTLTYAENMTDTKRLYDDYRAFIQRLRRAYPIDGYLVAFEPQKRGAWHAHLLLISHDAFLRIPNKRMREIWGFGYTKTQRVKNIRDIGSYLTSYLTNFMGKKGVRKGERLKMYPVGFHFLRSSRNGIFRTITKKWYGEFSDISFDGDIELIYDYEYYHNIGDKGEQVTKIFCFKQTS